MLDDVVELSATVDAALKTQTFHTAVLSYSADLACIYDGFYFYASHLIEIALCVFGYGVKGVRATEKNGNVTVLLRYDGFDISLLFTAQYNTPCCLLCVGQDHRYQELDLSNLYEREIESFAGMLRTGKMPFSYAQLAKPVYVIDAILESLRVDAEVSVSDETKRRN